MSYTNISLHFLCGENDNFYIRNIEMFYQLCLLLYIYIYIYKQYIVHPSHFSKYFIISNLLSLKITQHTAINI